MTSQKFSSGLAYLRILVPLKDGTLRELKLSGKSNLIEGDKVIISSIIGQEYHKKNFDPIIRYDGKKYLCGGKRWTPYGEKYSLKEVWNITNPGQYEQIDGNLAVIVVEDFPDGTAALRIRVPFKNGNSIDLKLSNQSYLEEGDEILISSITCQEYRKPGLKPIVRFDGELYD